MLIKGTEPFFFPNGEIACLLVHGFTSSPREMRPLGEALAAQGYTVLGIRLFAHGTRYQDMPRARWQDWIANIEDGWYLLNGGNRPLILIGFSLGGALSLYFSTLFPVKAIIAIAAPYYIPYDPRAKFLKLFSIIYPYIPVHGKGVWFNQKERANHIRYPNDATRALYEIRNFLQVLQSTAAQITAPTLLVYSKNDPTIRVQDHHIEGIYNGINSQIKETLWVENSGHIIPLDAERDHVFQACLNFIQRVVS